MLLFTWTHASSEIHKQTTYCKHNLQLYEGCSNKIVGYEEVFGN